MSRWDVKVIYTQEFVFAIEAESAQEASNEVVARMQAGAVEKPESTDMRTVVQRGVT